MSILSWNCQGLGNHRAVRDLHQMMKEKRPVLVFLMETKLCNKKAEFLQIKLHFDYMFVVDCVGRSGGLILLWNSHANVIIQNYCRRHVNAIVTLGKNGFLWKFSEFYGQPVEAKQHELWHLLRHLPDYPLARGCAWGTLMKL
jgi:exonuclease III